MSRSAVIVQARLRATRLPGKVMINIAGKSLLAHVLERCGAIPGIDEVVCAIPLGAGDDVLAAEALRLGVLVVRGPEDDVLERYRMGAERARADAVLRVTADCPLIDPAVCGEVLALVARGAAQFASNNDPPSWPHGLDCEAFPRDWLERAAREAQKPSEREHVSPFIRHFPGIRRANLACPLKGVHHHRWSVDYPEDLAFMREMFARLPEGPEGWNWRVPLAIAEADPGLAGLNARPDPYIGYHQALAAEA